jgi:hypothetical protein
VSAPDEHGIFDPDYVDPESDVEVLRRVIDSAFGTDAAHGQIAAALVKAGWKGPRAFREALRGLSEAHEMDAADKWRMLTEAAHYDPEDPGEDDYGTCVREALAQNRARAIRHAAHAIVADNPGASEWGTWLLRHADEIAEQSA